VPQQLWSLFDWVHSGQLLGTFKTFASEYEDPIMRGRQKDATVGQQRLGHDLTQNLRQLIKPFFLRRTKTEKLKLKHSSCAPYQSSSDRSS